jgi:hypothetical protein
VRAEEHHRVGGEGRLRGLGQVVEPRAPFAAHPRDGDVRPEGPGLGLPWQGVGQALDDGGPERGEHAVGLVQADGEHVRSARGEPQRVGEAQHRRRRAGHAAHGLARGVDLVQRAMAEEGERQVQGVLARGAQGAIVRGGLAAEGHQPGADVGRELERSEEAGAHREGSAAEATVAIVEQ